MKRMICFFVVTLALTSLKAQDTTLAAYTGTYKFPEGSPATSADVKIENGGLTINSAAGSSPLERIAVDTFSLVAYGGTAYFTRDADKKVDGVRIDVQGTILEGKKETPNLAFREYIYPAWRKENL